MKKEIKNIEKAKEITDLLLKEDDVSHYPLMLLSGLLLISLSIKNYYKKIQKNTLTKAQALIGSASFNKQQTK
jgi:hypothetical protein